MGEARGSRRGVKEITLLPYMDRHDYGNIRVFLGVQGTECERSRHG